MKAINMVRSGSPRNRRRIIQNSLLLSFGEANPPPHLVQYLDPS